MLVCMVLASDEVSLIPFPFLLAPLMCSVGREKLFERHCFSKIIKKYFLIQAQKKNFADALLI